MKKLYALVFFLGIAVVSKAQQDPTFTQYMFNYGYFNPAYVGTEGVTKVNVSYRNQWTGYTPTLPTNAGAGAPETQFVGINAPILSQRVGLGFHVINDRIGTMSRMDFLISGSYQIKVGENKLSLGLNTGFISRGFDLSKLIFADPNDPIAQDDALFEVRPDLGLGAFWRGQNYYVGVSFNHLLKTDLAFGSTRFRSPLSTHAYAFAGYEFMVANKWLLTPSVLLKTDLNAYSVDLGIVASTDDAFYGGITWRESEAINAIVGYNVLANAKKQLKNQWLRVSYSFDLVITEAQAKQRTSHEIMLSYILPNPNVDSYSIERTPRFNQGR